MVINSFYSNPFNLDWFYIISNDFVTQVLQKKLPPTMIPTNAGKCLCGLPSSNKKQNQLRDQMKTINYLILSTSLFLFIGNVSAANPTKERITALEAQVQALIVTVTELQATLDSRVTTIAESQTTLDNRVTTLSSNITNLQTNVSNINNNTVLQLDKLLTYGVDSKGYPIALFSGVNLQVVNGDISNATNGLGNIIIGYNFDRTAGGEICSLGGLTDLTSCTNAGGTWAISHKTGSHNFVGGPNNSYSSYHGMVLGFNNAINNAYANVTGGSENIASAFGSTVTSGYANIASGTFSSAAGGSNNKAIGPTSNVSGGYQNTASGASSSILGGAQNTANASVSSVSGGNQNTASSGASSVSGGFNRSATGQSSWAAGSLFESQ